MSKISHVEWSSIQGNDNTENNKIIKNVQEKNPFLSKLLPLLASSSFFSFNELFTENKTQRMFF